MGTQQHVENLLGVGLESGFHILLNKRDSGRAESSKPLIGLEVGLSIGLD
jgi:hypothetical protein